MDRMEILEEMSAAVPKDVFRHEPPKHDPKRGKLRFMIGLARSGKSTWAKRWEQSSPREGFPRVIVCADNIRLAVTGLRYNSKAEPVIHMVKHYMIETLLSSGHDVLVDGTHTTESSIREMLKLDREASYTLINTPAEVCKERAVASGQSDLIPVIDKMSRQLTRLLEKGIDQTCQKLKLEML